MILSIKIKYLYILRIFEIFSQIGMKKDGVDYFIKYSIIMVFI